MTFTTRNLSRVLAYLAVFWLVLSACTGYNPPTAYAVQLEPSPTPVRSRQNASVPLIITATTVSVPLETQAPLATSTPLPTETLPPTSTPTEKRELILGEPENVPDGGFSFRPLVGYDVNVLPGQVTLVSQDGYIIFSLAGGTSLSGTPLDSILGRLLENVSKELDAFQAGEPYPFTIGQSQGLAANVVGKMSNAPVIGQVAIVAPTNTQVFYVLAFAVNPVDQNLWDSSGQEAFSAVTGSITFFEPSE